MRGFMIKWLLLLFGSTFINAFSVNATDKDISHIPEAPVLPPLNLNGLRYIHNAESIKEQVSDASDIEFKDVSGDSKPEMNFDEMRRQTKTYGFSLRSGEGFSWNDINGGPDVHYENINIDNEGHKEYNDGAQEMAKPDYNLNLGNEQSRPAENLNLGNDHSTPFDNHSSGHVNSMPMSNLNSENDPPRPIDNEISGNHYLKPTDSVNLGNDYSRPIDNQNFEKDDSIPIDNFSYGNDYSRPNNNLNSDDQRTKPNDYQNSGDENSRPNDNLILEKDQPVYDRNSGNDNSRPIDNLNLGYHYPRPNETRNDYSHSENSKGDESSHENFWFTPEAFARILNDDKFWEWFSEWVEFYYDVISKYIENNIKEEVAKQLSTRRYYNREVDRTRIDQDANTINIRIIPEERRNNYPEKISINYEEIAKSLIHELKNALSDRNDDENHRQIKIIINTEKKEEANRTESRQSTHKEDAKNGERENNDVKLRRAYNETFGNHYGFKEVIKAENERNDDSHKIEKGRPGNYTGGKNYEVHSENIYGNSVGNDEVTNIYIFYPNESNDVVKDLIYSYSKNKEHSKRNDDTEKLKTDYDGKNSADNRKRMDENSVEDKKYDKDANISNGNLHLKDNENDKNIITAEDSIDLRSFGGAVQQ